MEWSSITTHAAELQVQNSAVRAPVTIKRLQDIFHIIIFSVSPLTGDNTMMYILSLHQIDIKL